ncbi:NADH-quinone oxidoreductase protein [Arachis hypogaea]|nr:NADH-quinone oxidoreductase protein [Arachis hypogaea]
MKQLLMQDKIELFTFKKIINHFFSSFTFSRGEREIGPHKGMGAVERFHIAEPKGSTPVRDRSMTRHLVPTVLKSTYALSPVH